MPLRGSEEKRPILICDRLKGSSFDLCRFGSEAIEFVMEGLEHCLNFCDRLSREECIPLLKKTKGLVSVDTGMSYVVAATETPSVVLFSGIYPMEMWSPLNPKARVLKHTHPVLLAIIQRMSVDELHQRDFS